MVSLATIETPPMVKPRSEQKPTFLWQAMFIILPVAVLAAVGLFSLRQDKLLAEQEAREQAQAIAWPLAHECGARLGTEINQFAEASLKQQETIALTAGTLKPGPGQDAVAEIRDGQGIVLRWQKDNPAVQLSALPQTLCYFHQGVLDKPADYPIVPQPADWFVHLPAEEARQWNMAELAWARQDAPATRSVLEAIARTRHRSDDPLRANAELRLLLIESGIPEVPGRFRALLKLARRFPRVQTETGLPLSAIA